MSKRDMRTSSSEGVNIGIFCVRKHKMAANDSMLGSEINLVVLLLTSDRKSSAVWNWEATPPQMIYGKYLFIPRFTCYCFHKNFNFCLQKTVILSLYIMCLCCSLVLI